MMSKTASLVFGLGVLIAVVIFMMMPAPQPEAAPPLQGTAAAGQLPEGHPAIPQAADAAVAQGPFATVLETMNSGGYTYARVQADAEEIWVAGPVTEVRVGDEISLAGAMGMENFSATSLGRTFESILFVSRFAGRAQAPAGQTGTAMEVLHGGGYTYVRVDQDGTELWVAGLPVDVKEGQTVSWNSGSPMENFSSPTLDRTFERILFVDGLRVQG